MVPILGLKLIGRGKVVRCEQKKINFNEKDTLFSHNVVCGDFFSLGV